jgi:hypothetical protein
MAMEKSGRTMGLAAGLALASLALAACTPPALVKYEQRGACNGFMHAGGMTNAGPNQAYVVFKVTEVSNTADKAVDFNFDPERLYVDLPLNDHFVDSDIQVSALNPFALQGRLVKAGTTETFNGAAIAVVPTAATNGASEARQTKYTLRYSALGPPGADTVDLEPDPSVWNKDTPDCADIAF